MSSANEMHWTPISGAPEFDQFGSYLVDAPFAIHPQFESHTSSSSAGDASTDGDLFKPDSIDAGDHVRAAQRSASPNTGASDSRIRNYRGIPVTDSPSFQSRYVSDDSGGVWVSNDEYLKPSPTSPPLVSPYKRAFSETPSYSFPSTSCQSRMNLRPNSPLSTSISINGDRTSMSPTRSTSHLSHEDITPPANGKRKKHRRKAHNDIEKRYRIRLNEKIAELRDSIPSLRVNAGSPQDGVRKDSLAGSLHKVNKANVLEKATEYIKSLEMCNQRLQAELNRMINMSRSNHTGMPMQPIPSNYTMMENNYETLPPTLQRNHPPDPYAYMTHEQQFGYPSPK